MSALEAREVVFVEYNSKGREGMGAYKMFSAVPVACMEIDD